MYRILKHTEACKRCDAIWYKTLLDNKRKKKKEKG